MSRPERKCSSCGDRTTSIHGLCRTCKPSPVAPLEPADILVDGDWVLRGLTRVWVPWEDDGWARLAAAPDDELTCRRRLAALVAEADGTPDPRRATA